MSSAPSQTPLHDWHASHGGRMVDFAGWSMPVQYGSIVAEHQATRSAAALFDVSHMGRLTFEGSGAGAFLDNLVTRRIDDLPPGQIRYALVTNDDGGILDDVLVYHLSAGSGEPYYLMVVNASNRPIILGWIQERIGSQVRCTDRTRELAMIAVQGPLASQLVETLTAAPLSETKYYHGREALIDGHPGIISRTGYTGEDGFELMAPAEAARSIWTSLLELRHSDGVMAAGLGARDTLRLEAGMPLYGHELSEKITPLEAGLDFAVDLESRAFPGSDVLRELKQAGPPERQRIGLELAGKRVPREQYAISAGGETIGAITSGTFSPTLQRPIAMGYVRREFAKPGAEVMVDIRGAKEPARVVKLPFYRRAKK